MLQRFKKQILILGVLLAGMILLLSNKPTVESSSICRHCGVQRELHVWRARFAKLAIWRFYSDSETPVSRVLEENNLVEAHEHEWVDALAKRGDYAVPAGEAECIEQALYFRRTERFLACLARYGDRATAKAWRNMVLDPEQAQLVHPALRFERFPEAGFRTRQEFLNWWQTHGFLAWNDVFKEIQD
jgi:hypothetical protein